MGGPQPSWISMQPGVGVVVWFVGRQRGGGMKGKRGSLVVVIPFQLAEPLEVGDEPTLHCILDSETRSIVHRKAD